MKKVDIATSTDDINHNNNITNFDQIGNDNDIGIIKQKIKISQRKLLGLITVIYSVSETSKKSSSFNVKKTNDTIIISLFDIDNRS